MEHEVFVPFPAGRLSEALADPVRIARAIPGLQQDASAVPGDTADPGTPFASGAGRDAGRTPVRADGEQGEHGGHGVGGERIAGRLKVRVAGHTITYRGAFRVTAQDDGSYAVEGDATEVRGAGAVKLALTLRLLSAEGGTTLAFGGTASGDGRVAELPHDAVSSAGRRLLNRFGESLAAALATPAASPSAAGSTPVAASPSEDGTERAAGPGAGAESGPEARSGAEPSSPGAAPTPESGTGAGPEAVARSEPGVESESASGAGAEAASELKPEGEAEPDSEAEVEAGSKSGAGAEVEAEREREGGAEAGPDSGAGSETGSEAEVEGGAEVGSGSEGESGAGREAGTPSVFEEEVPPGSLGAVAGDGEFDGATAEEFVADDREPGSEDPMAEAAHARRTMIGRSAEEVDHAPPRGRYAPVPPPEATAARATLRWAAPAAALALASAIAVTRALRKRR